MSSSDVKVDIDFIFCLSRTTLLEVTKMTRRLNLSSAQVAFVRLGIYWAAFS